MESRFGVMEHYVGSRSFSDAPPSVDRSLTRFIAYFLPDCKFNVGWSLERFAGPAYSTLDKDSGSGVGSSVPELCGR